MVPASRPLFPALLVVCLAAGASGQSAAYTLIDIGDLAPPGETDGTNATGMNELGHVAAVTGDGSGPLGVIPVLYRDGQLVDLGAFPGSISFGGAKGVNNLDQVSGWSMAPWPTGGWQSEPFLWTEGQGMVNPTVQPPFNPSGEMWDVNDSGQAVFTTKGSFWDPATGLTPVDLGYGKWRTWDLNEDGVVAGSAYGSNGPLHAVRYESATANLVELHDVLVDYVSDAYGINDLGDIVGWSGRLDGSAPSMIWTAGGQSLALPVGDLGPNQVEGSAEHINNHGDVVGLDEFPGPSGGDPALEPIGWVAFGATSAAPVVKVKLLDLIDPAAALAWRRLHPFEINDRGEICGIATAAQPGLPSGGARGFLMVPNTPDHWRNLGRALAGTNGHPVLIGTGTLDAGTALELRLFKAAPQATGFLVLGLAALDLPFRGGVLVPDPFGPGGLLLPVHADGSGALALAGAWPAGSPAGLDIYAQYWAADPAGPVGYAASNAITQATP